MLRPFPQRLSALQVEPRALGDVGLWIVVDHCHGGLVGLPYGSMHWQRTSEAMTTVTQAYRFALDPTPTQRRVMASHCGAARVAYNWGLELVKTRLDQHQIDPSVRVPWTLPELRWHWNRAKEQVAPWWAENSKEAYSAGLDGVARALKNSGVTRGVVAVRAARSASHDSRRRDAPETPAGSPPPPSRCSPTASTSSSRASASSRPRNPPASCPTP